LIVVFSGFSIGIYNGILFTELFVFIFGLVMIVPFTLFVAGVIYPYWWGYVKITNTRIIFREQPFIKFNVFSKVEFMFSSKLVVNFNLKTNRLTFWQDDIDRPGLLILDGLSPLDLKKFRKVLCNIKNIDLTLENE